MAIGRLSVKIGRAGKAAPHAAYIARAGQYAARAERGEKLEATEAGNMPAWAQHDPLVFWQAADAFERKNGTTYREMEIALPRELTPEQRLALVREWVKQEIGERHAYQFAIHSPRASDGGEQPHAHIMFCEREIDGIERDPEQYFKRYNAKNPERGGARKANTGKDAATRRSELKGLRERWESMCNAHLERAFVDARIDMRSNAARGLDLPPERKQLPSQWRGQGRAQVLAFRAARAELADARQAVAQAIPAPGLALRALSAESRLRRAVARGAAAQSDLSQYRREHPLRSQLHRWGLLRAARIYEIVAQIDESDAAVQRHAEALRAANVDLNEFFAGRGEKMERHQYEQFLRYANAVNADRYRVTSISADSQKALILDKRDGVSRGFTPFEMSSAIDEMRKLAARGENLYYTPISDARHHILIDDMSRAALRRLIDDGYAPAVVIESSPGNYQCLLTIQKLGTPHDRDVANRLAERLNREYGDEKLSGAIHPHRAPGFENRKLKHQRPDGSYPEVRLLRAERRECAKTLALSREIDAEYAEYAQRAAQAAKTGATAVRTAGNEPPPAAALAAASDAATAAYGWHYRDVLKRQGRQSGDLDLSRVDSMIAVRLRVGGFSQSEIESTLRALAPTIRPASDTSHSDWGDYAARTARYAYSPAGSEQAERLSKYRDRWPNVARAPRIDDAKLRERINAQMPAVAVAPSDLREENMSHAPAPPAPGVS